ncbi:histidinol-phosphate transaminase [Aestuariirhabdus sp. Z084]|uniref:histidinol-phosphate transaminase n=1 Tax=Aestuariirhabdus haliotis TaxID=2918751 RepID=UPI00201B3E64|nr:histidinol-phosphate transaminase [Aestuariirhabdus haliotis]MCL6417658.1 histidinol-phosphate transaminase [Aestuariirhabdus haliotis]MCL6421580.1 histidinol-phosphate transaminase [Aestuariirhabdus haliotis]
MSSLADQLAAPAVKALIPYQSARRIGGEGHLWLNANELEADFRSDDRSPNLHRYPDFLPHELAEAYQQYSGVDCSVVAVRGADEAIELLVRAFCQPGKDRLMICPPTYAMYDFCGEAASVAVDKVPLLDDFQLDMPRIKAGVANSHLLFLCSPNNPTGNLINRDDIIELLEYTKDSTLVVVDEAYIEFAPDHSVANLIAEYPHLVVIRTLSKAFGLAAVRCGFVLANASVMAYLNKVIAPYPIPDPSAKISLTALLPNNVAEMRRATEQLIAVREQFVERIKHLPCIESVYESHTNFVLIRQRKHESAEAQQTLFSYLIDQGIVARDQSQDPALEGCVRITIGEPDSMDEVATALENYQY